LSSQGFIEQQEGTGTWSLDELTIAENRLTAADVTRVSMDDPLCADMLEYVGQSGAVTSDDDCEHDVSASLALKDFLKRR